MDLATTSARFERLYRDIVIADVKREMPGLFEFIPPPATDVAYALSVASRLALIGSGATSETAAAARKAYDIAIRTLAMGNGAGRTFREASAVILGRLGNCPARQVLSDRFAISDEPMDALSALELLAREYENRVIAGDQRLHLTDFQVRLMRSLETKKYVSVSAPTSAGKSYTLELEILRRLQDPRPYRAVYLVPTRALIRQVTFDLVHLVRGTPLQDVPILSVPSPPDNPAQKIVYVLTQERFANLLSTAGDALGIDALIIDEAQEIADQSRGQTLEAVIEEALTRFPNAKVFFSSPLKSNPEYLLKLFPTSENADSFVEHLTPVSQNIINIYPVKGRGNTSRARFEIWFDDEPITIGVADLPFRFRRPYMANMVVRLTAPGDTSIIYCNDPSTADKTAAAIADAIQEEDSEDAVTDLADFLRSHIHSKYRLATVLEHGVAFHYGNIPQIIRGRIEELLRERRLPFVCCTSTLLQGMNLPAKNIFVENPKKGKGRPMAPGDFWNLVGRAGRMAKEFVGNVYCIHAADWESQPLKGARLDAIRSAFSLALSERIPEVVQVASSVPASTESELSWAEQAVARVFGHFTKKGRRISESRFSNPGNRNGLQALDEILGGISSRQTLPDLIFEQNLYLHPLRLEELASRFRSSNIDQWVLPNPNAKELMTGCKLLFSCSKTSFFVLGFKPTSTTLS